MKLGKEEIQKIVLGVLLFFGLIYSYFDMLLGPLTKRTEVTKHSAETLVPQIQSSKAMIQKAKDMEKDFANATLVMRQVEAMIPDGSPVAWFPPHMQEFFKKQGVERASTRMTGDTVDREMPKFHHIAWGVDLPKVDFVTFGKAVATLENEEPLIEISAIQIDASRDDVESQHVFVTVNNLVKK
jgi:hypothetical protein